MPGPNGKPLGRPSDTIEQSGALQQTTDTKNNSLQGHNKNFSLSDEQLQTALDSGSQSTETKKDFIIQLIATKGDTWFDNFRFGSNQEKNNGNLTKLLAYAFKKNLTLGEFKSLSEEKLAKFNNPTKNMSLNQKNIYTDFDKKISSSTGLNSLWKEFIKNNGTSIQGEKWQQAEFIQEYFDENGDIKKGVENYQLMSQEIRKNIDKEKLGEKLSYIKAKNQELLANQEFTQDLQEFENNQELIKDPAMEQKIAKLNQEQGLTGEQAITVRDIMMGEMILQDQDKYANLVDDEYLQNITAIRESIDLSPSLMPHTDLMQRSAAEQPTELTMSNINTNAHMIEGMEQSIAQSPNSFETPDALDKAVNVEDPAIFTNFLPPITQGIPENFAQRLTDHYQDASIISEKESIIAHYQLLQMALYDPPALASTIQTSPAIPDEEKANALQYYTNLTQPGQQESLQQAYTAAEQQAAHIVKEMMLPTTNAIFKQESFAGFLNNVSSYFSGIGDEFVVLDGKGASMTPEGGFEVELAIKDVNGQLPLDENGNPTASTKVIFAADGTVSIVDPLGGDEGFISYEMRQIIEGIPTPQTISNPGAIRMDRVLEKAGSGYGNKKREAVETLISKAVNANANALHKQSAGEVQSQLAHNLTKIKTQQQCIQLAIGQRGLTPGEQNQPGPYQMLSQRFSYKKFKEGGNPPQLSNTDPQFESFYRMAKVIDRTTDRMSASEQNNLINQLTLLQDSITQRAQSPYTQELNQDPIMKGLVSQEARKRTDCFPNIVTMMCRDKNERTKTLEPQLVQATTELVRKRDPARPGRSLFERPAFNVIKRYPNALTKIEEYYMNPWQRDGEMADNWVDRELEAIGETSTDNIYKQFSKPNTTASPLEVQTQTA